jgi:hypothetical protein
MDNKNQPKQNFIDCFRFAPEGAAEFNVGSHFKCAGVVETGRQGGAVQVCVEVIGKTVEAVVTELVWSHVFRAQNHGCDRLLLAVARWFVR